MIGILISLVVGYWGSTWQHGYKVKQMGLQTKLDLLMAIYKASAVRAIEHIADVAECTEKIDFIFARTLEMIKQLERDTLTKGKWIYFYYGNRSLEGTTSTVVHSDDKKS